MVRNGVLLCRSLEIITNRPSLVRGWIRKPKTAKVGRANIEKALNAMRTLPDMGQRYVWKGDDIHSGSREDILGVLEDLHIYHDGLTPRPTYPTELEEPYFGAHVPTEEEPAMPYTFPESGTGRSLLMGRPGGRGPSRSGR